MLTIGNDDNTPEDALANVATIRSYLRSKAGADAVIQLQGDVYLDIRDGPLFLGSGGPGQPRSLIVRGPGRVIGIRPNVATTPVLDVVRGPGRAALLKLSDFDLSSEGSGILWRNGGARSVLENVLMEDIRGQGFLDQDSMNDVRNGECAYGLRVQDADGLFVDNLVVHGCSGHGVICDRWHKGALTAYCRECRGSGFKLDQANDLYLDARAESNFGFGFVAADCGIDRYEHRRMQASDGGPNLWRIWNEANNGRGVTGSHGYRYSQMKLDNVARATILGHCGWQSNQVRVDPCSRDHNIWIDEIDPPRSEPVFPGLPVSLPHDNWGNVRVTNWDVVWPDSRSRPTVEVKGEGFLIRWPAGCLASAVGTKTAYWRPFGSILRSPGTYVFSADCVDITGAISDYCVRREQHSLRQAPAAAELLITPVAGAITGVSLWDKAPHTFVGRTTVKDGRADIGLGINAWSESMTQVGPPHARQMAEHVLFIRPKFWIA